MFWPLCAASAQVVDAPGPAQADLPISRVALYTSGVGYFERSGAVDGDASETLLFPIDEINDILKSLVLLDLGGGTIEPVTYAAQDPVEKELQAFSVDLSDNPDEATLLNRLRGAQISVTGPQFAGSGTILGVETKTIQLPNGGGTTSASHLHIMAADGMRTVDMSTIATVQFLDPKLDGEIRQELAAVAEGRDSSKRAVTLNFDGKGRRDVVVGYIAETPLWQTSYRLVLGDKPVMQGWAIVQNTSQDDWNGVHLSLVSGRPVSFIQDLYTPIYVPRQTVQAQVANAPPPTTYDANIQAGAGGSASAEANGVETLASPVAAMPAPMQEPHKAADFSGGPAGRFSGLGGVNGALLSSGLIANQSVPTSGVMLGSSLFTYDIDIPVTVPRRQSAMIPFLSADVQARRVSIYNADVLADHPMSGARMVNTSKLHLMGGPITVFDEQQSGGTGYVGDAEMDDTEPGETRLFSFAVDLAVDAASTDGPDQGLSHTLVIDHGVLHDSVKTISSTVYTFKNNADQDRLLVVEHPFSGDNYTLVEPAKADEKTSDRYRFDVPLAAKESKTFTVKEEHTDYETYGLVDCDMGTLVAFSSQGGISPDMQAALEQVIRQRRAIGDTQDAIQSAGADIDAISAGQERIRKNMNALDKSSALYKRYVGELDAQETQIEDLSAKRDDLNAQYDKEESDLHSYIAGLTVK
jgi:hypothetical protein